MNKTNIEYLDYSWNPLAMRCTPISEGCVECWHIKMADRLAKMPGIMFNEEMSYRGINKPYLVKERLDDPLKRKKPAIIGVQFMGDLFHKDISFRYLFTIWGIMAKAHWHTFLILTKRPAEMNYNLAWIRHYGRLANVILGVTVESDKYLWRIKELIKIPAAKRFVSLEPLLSPINLCGDLLIDNIDWVIAGCESGPGRRPAKIEWFRDLKNQCVDAGVPFFLKQMTTEPPVMAGCETGLPLYYENFKSKVIKLPELDGRQWNERP